MVMRRASGWASMAARLWARMSMSTPTTRASAGPPQAALTSSIEAENTSEPPWAMPVSMMRSGCTAQISSCIATMSCGYWMIGRPSHSKW